MLQITKSPIGSATRSLLAKNRQILGTICALAILALVFSIYSPVFMTSRNIVNIFRNTSVYGIMALGMTIVILTGGIDLSVGATMALGGAIGAGLLGQAYGAANPIALSPSLSIMIAICVTTCVGIINGVLITKMKITPFVVTLGTMTVVRGLTYIFNDQIVQGIPGSPITFWNTTFDFIGSGDIFGRIPFSAFIFVLMVLLLGILLKYTVFGRNVYAIGGDSEIARLAGIKVHATTIVCYALLGALSGIAGILFTGRLLSAAPLAGDGYEMDVITAVILGGGSLDGGRGGIIGTLFGVLLIGVLNNGLDILYVPSFYQYLIKGFVLIAAVVVQNRLRKDIAKEGGLK